jgi:hypothetical protein
MEKIASAILAKFVMLETVPLETVPLMEIVLLEIAKEVKPKITMPLHPIQELLIQQRELVPITQQLVAEIQIQLLEEIQTTITVMLGIQETVMLALPVQHLENLFKLVEETVGLGKILTQTGLVVRLGTLETSLVLVQHGNVIEREIDFVEHQAPLTGIPLVVEIQIHLQEIIKTLMHQDSLQATQFHQRQLVPLILVLVVTVLVHTTVQHILAPLTHVQLLALLVATAVPVSQHMLEL